MYTQVMSILHVILYIWRGFDKFFINLFIDNYNNLIEHGDFNDFWKLARAIRTLVSFELIFSY